MIPDASNPHRQQDLYWNQMVELKVAACYMRRYRDQVGLWVTSVGVVRAIASSGSIAAWAIWRQYAFVWGLIIAASQVADALREVFPFVKTNKAASEFGIALERLFIDAQLEWESVFSGRYSDEEAVVRLHQLRKLKLEAECQSFPSGLAANEGLLTRAEQDAARYFELTYGE